MFKRDNQLHAIAAKNSKFRYNKIPFKSNRFAQQDDIATAVSPSNDTSSNTSASNTSSSNTSASDNTSASSGSASDSSYSDSSSGGSSD